MSLYIGTSKITPVREVQQVLGNDEAIIKYQPSTNGLTNSITEIRDLNISQYMDVSSLCQGYSKLLSINFKELPTNSIAIVAGFSGCTSLISSPINSDNSLKFNNFMQTFYNCSSLQNVPVFNIAPSIGLLGLMNTFYGCNSLTDDSLNNIMQTCINAGTKIVTGYRSLKGIGLSSTQATRCQSLSNYDAFVAADWSTGY